MKQDGLLQRGPLKRAGLRVRGDKSGEQREEGECRWERWGGALETLGFVGLRQSSECQRLIKLPVLFFFFSFFFKVRACK